MNGKSTNSGEVLAEQKLLDGIQKELSTHYPKRKFDLVVSYLVKRINVRIDLSMNELTKEAQRGLERLGGELITEAAPNVIFKFDRPWRLPLGVWALFFTILNYGILYIWLFYSDAIKACSEIGWNNCASAAIVGLKIKSQIR